MDIVPIVPIMFQVWSDNQFSGREVFSDSLVCRYIFKIITKELIFVGKSKILSKGLASVSCNKLWFKTKLPMIFFQNITGCLSVPCDCLSWLDNIRNGNLWQDTMLMIKWMLHAILFFFDHCEAPFWKLTYKLLVCFLVMFYSVLFLWQKGHDSDSFI